MCHSCHIDSQAAQYCLPVLQGQGADFCLFYYLWGMVPPPRNWGHYSCLLQFLLGSLSRRGCNCGSPAYNIHRQWTLNTMDELLKALVCEDEKPNLVVLQNIVEVLLPWTASKEVHVRLRAMGRITWLTKFISGQHKFKGVEEFRVLGQLVGCLTLHCAEQEQEICRSAMEGLHHLYAFMLRQKCTTLAKQSAEYLQVFREWRAENSFWVTWFTNTSNIAMRIYHSSQFSIIRKFAESAIHTILQIIYEDIEQNRPQDRPLGHST
ncbi:unnamed protein product [Lepidochelys kempii]